MSRSPFKLQNVAAEIEAKYSGIKTKIVEVDFTLTLQATNVQLARVLAWSAQLRHQPVQSVTQIQPSPTLTPRHLPAMTHALKARIWTLKQRSARPVCPPATPVAMLRLA